MKTGHLGKAASCISAAAIGVGFFLPWLSVSLDVSALDRTAGLGLSDLLRPIAAGLRLQYSAWELAAGPQVKLPFGAFWQLAGTPELWGVLVAAVAAIAFALVVGTQRLSALGVIAAGGFGLVMLAMSLQQLDSSRIPFTSVSTQPGLWLAAGGLAGLIVSGLLGLRAPAPASPPVTAPVS